MKLLSQRSVAVASLLLVFSSAFTTGSVPLVLSAPARETELFRTGNVNTPVDRELQRGLPIGSAEPASNRAHGRAARRPH